MHYPQFYDTVESIRLVDPLAKVLATFENGEYEISYIEVVKAAGHSCPTVAGAYLMADAALKVLYPEQRAVRGMVRVEFKEDLQDGVAGVIGNVITHITGATDKSGFKGLGGQFARHSLMDFNADINSSARFTRLDNSKSVDIIYDPSSVLPDPNMGQLMQKMQKALATPEDIKLFGELWQDRVKRIFQKSESVIRIVE
jgi:hypothetical protein